MARLPDVLTLLAGLLDRSLGQVRKRAEVLVSARLIISRNVPGPGLDLRPIDAARLVIGLVAPRAVDTVPFVMDVGGWIDPVTGTFFEDDLARAIRGVAYGTRGEVVLEYCARLYGEGGDLWGTYWPRGKARSLETAGMPVTVALSERLMRALGVVLTGVEPQFSANSV